MPHYRYFNFDDMFAQAADRSRLYRQEHYERQRQNEIDLQARQTEMKNQRAAVQTKRHKQKKIHAQTPKDVPAFLKKLTRKL